MVYSSAVPSLLWLYPSKTLRSPLKDTPPHWHAVSVHSVLQSLSNDVTTVSSVSASIVIIYYHHLSPLLPQFQPAAESLSAN